MSDLVKRYSSEFTRRALRNLNYLAARESRSLKKHRRKFIAASTVLALIAIMEYFIGYGFISYMLADGQSGHSVSAGAVALVVPLAAFAYHFRTKHDGGQHLAKRMRAFATAGIMILPVAMSLGLAITMANSIGGADIGGGNTFLGDDGGSQSGGFLSDLLIGFLNGAAPILIVMAFSTALAISFYVASMVISVIERSFDAIENAVDRSAVVDPILERFAEGEKKFRGLERKEKLAYTQLPDQLEEKFANDLFAQVNKSLVKMRRHVERRDPSGKNESVFERTLAPAIYIPESIDSVLKAKRWISKTRDVLRPQAVVDALGASIPKEKDL